MSSKKKKNEFIEIFEKTGLTYKEASVYFALIKAGAKGNIVKELIHALPIERTTIYSILRKLIKFGLVMEGGRTDKSKNATIFKALRPMSYFDNLIEKMKKELDRITGIKRLHSEALEKIYQNGMEFSYEELDTFIQPYFKPLLEKGWKIKSYVVKKEMPMFNYKVYDCVLYTPRAKFLKDNSFHVFIFDYNIEKDDNALKFFINSLKRKTREMKSYFFDIKDFQLVNDEINFNGKKYPVFNMKTKKNQLKNSKYFESMSEDLKKSINQDSGDFYEIGKAVIISVKKKLFYLWAESNEILKEMVAPIFEVEKI